MKGKILDINLIVGSDEKRYSFEASDIANAKEQSVQNLIGSEVDFEAVENTAKAIYITKSSSFNVNAIFENNDLNSIKLKAYIAMGCAVLGLLPVVGYVFEIISFVLMILVVIGINKSSGSKTLLRNFIIYALIVFFGGIIIEFSTAASFMAGLGLAAFGSAAGAFGSFGFAVVVGLIILIAGLVYGYFFYKELSVVTNESFFLYAFIAIAIGEVLIVPVLGALIVVVGYVLEIIAWIRFKEIRKVA